MSCAIPGKSRLVCLSSGYVRSGLFSPASTPSPYSPRVDAIYSRFGLARFRSGFLVFVLAKFLFCFVLMWSSLVAVVVVVVIATVVVVVLVLVLVFELAI